MSPFPTKFLILFLFIAKAFADPPGTEGSQDAGAQGSETTAAATPEKTDSKDSEKVEETEGNYACPRQGNLKVKVDPAECSYLFETLKMKRTTGEVVPLAKKLKCKCSAHIRVLSEDEKTVVVEADDETTAEITVALATGKVVTKIVGSRNILMKLANGTPPEKKQAIIHALAEHKQSTPNGAMKRLRDNAANNANKSSKNQIVSKDSSDGQPQAEEHQQKQ